MNFRKIIKALIFAAGVWLVLLGALWIYIAASGAVVAGVSFLLGSAPMLALPFSLRTAKWLLVALLLIFAAVMLWLAFQPGLPARHSALVQVAAIAFAVLLVARVGLSFRRKRPSPGV